MYAYYTYFNAKADFYSKSIFGVASNKIIIYCKTNFSRHFSLPNEIIVKGLDAVI